MSKRFLGQFWRPATRPPARRAETRRHRPALEELENRLAPATLTVNSNIDAVTANSNLTLREAIAIVNAGNTTGRSAQEVSLVSGTLGTNDTIQFSASVTSAGAATFTLVSQLAITKSVAIVGPTANSITLNGNNAGRVFVIDDSTAANLVVSLSGLNLTGGNGAGGDGGALFNNETLTLTNCALFGNTTTGAGGGIRNHEGGVLTLTNCTLSGNTANAAGGGIYNSKTLTVNLSTITGNRADNDNTGGEVGGGIGTSNVAAATTTLQGTIVAGNFSGSASTANDLGEKNVEATSTFNLIGNAVSAGGLTHGAGGNIVGNNGSGTLAIDSILNTTLAFNGGLARTHALAANSPAINSGSNALIPAGVTADQRGAPFTRTNGIVDMGAFEVQPPLIVDTTADVDNGNYAAGNFSIREAVRLANATPGADSIAFSSALNNQTIALTSGELKITDAATISGPGPGLLTVSGSNLSRIFNVDNGVTAFIIVTISGLTITAGRDNTDTAGNILNRETLTLSNAVVSNSNSAGVANYGIGNLTITNSTISGNTTPDSGGGVYSAGGSVEITASTITGNTATAGVGGGVLVDGGSCDISQSTITGNGAGTDGGGVRIGNFSFVTITNSTITGNSAKANGGGVWIESGSFLTLVNATLTANRANSDGVGAGSGGGLLAAAGSSTTLHNTLIAGNFKNPGTTTGDDVSGAAAAASSNNLIGNGTGLSGITSGNQGNQIGTAASPIDPKLGPLASNGGPTQTIALLTGSPAINAGDNSLIPVGVTSDQRGAPFTRTSGTVDIGAYEDQPPILLQSTATALTASPQASTGGTLVTFTATVNSGGSPVATGNVTFFDSGLAISPSVAVNAAGVAVFTTSGLLVGNHPVTAVYGGTSTFATSTSAPQSVSVFAPIQVVSVTPNANIAAMAGSQHSRIVSLVVVFNQAVELDAGAFVLSVHTNGVSFGDTAMPAGMGAVPTSLSFTGSADHKTWTITFSGNTDLGADGFASLKDGVYDLTILAAKVHPDGAPSVAMPANWATTFHRLFGDIDAPLTPAGGSVDFFTIVNTGDNFAFRDAFNKTGPGYLPYLDFDGSGLINTGDNLEFRDRFNKALIWRA
jgi:hypothetical protein